MAGLKLQMGFPPYSLMELGPERFSSAPGEAPPAFLRIRDETWSLFCVAERGQACFIAGLPSSSMVLSPCTGARIGTAVERNGAGHGDEAFGATSVAKNIDARVGFTRASTEEATRRWECEDGNSERFSETSRKTAKTSQRFPSRRASPRRGAGDDRPAIDADERPVVVRAAADRKSVV